jgi:hypothetical protein
MIEPTDEELLELFNESDKCIKELEELLAKIKTPKPVETNHPNTLHGITCDVCDSFLSGKACDQSHE